MRSDAGPGEGERDDAEALRQALAELDRAKEALRESEANLRDQEFWFAAQKEAFRAAMNGAPLETSLGILVDAAVRSAGDGRRCAFYIADPAGRKLRHVVGMPYAYAKAVEDFAASPESLACGPAIATGKPVVTPDVFEEPRWEPWRWLAQEYGYRGCWSFPVETVAGRLLGSFAMYLPEPRAPSQRDLELGAGLAQAASIIISHEAASDEQRRAQASLRENEQRLTVALEAGRMGTYRHDLRTGEQEWSAGQYEIFGLAPGQPPDRELFMSLVHPDDHHLVEFSAEDIREPGTYLDSEFRIIRPDGETRWVSAHALAIFDASGHPAELIGVNQDVTEQRRLAAAIHTSEERLREFSEASSDILWIRRADDLQWEYLSPAFHKIYGISRQDAMRGDNLNAWAELIVPEDRDTALGGIAKVRAGERVSFEYRVRRPEDGQLRWLRNTDFPIRDETGAVVRIGGIGHDLTDLKLAEEHQRFLLSELQHRVRNTLAVIRSIVRRSAATATSKDQFFTHLDGRIAAFARVQAAVTRDPSKPLDLAVLVAEELRVAAAQEGQGVSIDGPPVGLAPKTAENFGLAIHELATNAVKYGALSVGGGTINVAWSIAAGPPETLEFRWTERSTARMPTPPLRQGFGTEVLERTLAYELKATTTRDIGPTGIACHITIPLDQLSGRQAGEDRARSE